MNSQIPDSAPHPLPEPLDPVELRVLGALIEKEITTPEQYPLSLNALVNAANQRSSRDPVLDLDERQVRTALDSLEARSLVHSMHDARVAKYEHRARTVLNLRRDETALLCLLLLRGPQTPGELRSRADRLFAFDDLDAVQSTLSRLASRLALPGMPYDAWRMAPLVLQLARQPGAREARFSHLLGGLPTVQAVTSVPAVHAPAPSRLDHLETEVAELRVLCAELAERLHRLEAPSQTNATESGSSSPQLGTA